MRTTVTAVKGILGGNYGGNSRQCEPDLTPYIRTASAVVDDLVTCAEEKGITLSASKLALIEMWLAAHYYTRMDPTYKSRNTLRAGGTFNTDGSEYRSVAENLDSTGCMEAILEGYGVAELGWGGKNVPDQRTDEERN